MSVHIVLYLGGTGYSKREISVWKTLIKLKYHEFYFGGNVIDFRKMLKEDSRVTYCQIEEMSRQFVRF